MLSLAKHKIFNSPNLTLVVLTVAVSFFFSARSFAADLGAMIQAGKINLPTLEEESKKKLRVEAEDISRQLEQEPKNSRLYFMLGQVYSQLSDYDKALVAFQKALLLEPSDSRYHYAKGAALYASEKLKEALPEFIEATRLDPKDSDYWVSLSRVYSQLDEPAEAEQAIKKAYALNPESPSIVTIYGEILTDLGRNKEALEQFNNAIGIDPERVSSYMDLGQLNQRMGNYDQAIKAFMQVLKLDPNLKEAQAKLVQTYQAMGDLEKRDAAIAKLHAMYKNSNAKQKYCREQSKMKHHLMMAFEHFDNTQDNGSFELLSFLLIDEKTAKPIYIVALTQISKSLIEKPDQSMHQYSLEGYSMDGKVRTYKLFDNKPSYEEIRPAVLKILSKFDVKN